ncbi:MAG: hypothetical protein AAGI89_15010 [Pseudomonadota bacterium]
MTDPILHHNWGSLVTYGAIEIYPYTNGNYDTETNEYGGLRAHVESFSHLAHNGRYSKDLGTVSLPRMGDPYVALLNGFITDGTVPVARDRVKVHAFQQEGPPPQNIVTSTTGEKFYGFSSDGANDLGFYSTGPVPQGWYKIYVHDELTDTQYIFWRYLTIYGERIDFDISQNCFGEPVECSLPGPND